MNPAPQECLALAEEKDFFFKKNTLCKHTLRFQEFCFELDKNTHILYI